MGRMRVNAIIFDLDDTLFDCTGQLTTPALRRAANRMAPSIPSLDEEALCALQADLADTLGSAGAIREIGRRHGLSPGLVESALKAYNRSQVESIFPFPDAHSTLTELQRRGYRLALVTSGRPERQRQKVRLLGLESYFDEARGALIFHDDRAEPRKDAALQRAAGCLDAPPERILAVGDKLDAEIAAANRLGMATARLRHGRQKGRRPERPEERPDCELDRLSDLLHILP